jgi:hypothetical protein
MYSVQVVAAAEWYDGFYYRQELHAIDWRQARPAREQASPTARKDILQRRMTEMKTMEMEVRRQMATLVEKHMRQMEEMKMLTTQMTQKLEWMKMMIIGQQQTILKQQQTTLELLQTTLEQVASVNYLVCRRLQ